MTYNNIKIHKKQVFHPVFRNTYFEKLTLPCTLSRRTSTIFYGSFSLIFSKISKFFYNKKNKNYFKENHHQLFNNQSSELSSSNEVENIIQEGKVIFKKKSTLILTEG